MNKISRYKYMTSNSNLKPIPVHILRTTRFSFVMFPFLKNYSVCCLRWTVMIAEVFDTMTTTIFNNKIPSSSLFCMNGVNIIMKF